MNALIVVDLQNDFLQGGALAVPHGHEVIPLADELQKRFDVVVATKDWHPSDDGSFAANHKEKKPGDRIILDVAIPIKRLRVSRLCDGGRASCWA